MKIDGLTAMTVISSWMTKCSTYILIAQDDGAVAPDADAILVEPRKSKLHQPRAIWRDQEWAVISATEGYLELPNPCAVQFELKAGSPLCE
jgi:hypothetical protein